MQSEAAPVKTRDPHRMILALIVAAIVVSVGMLGYVLYLDSQAATVQTTPVVVAGDKIKVDYIGMLPDGRVFDTSMLSVASNNVLYPKSLTFTMRANDSYKPFEMTAGLTGTGGTIEGFANGVIGMHVNETKLIEVPIGEGYAANPEMVVTTKIVEQIPGTETYSETDFKQLFGTEPVLMQTVKHFFWGWNVLIVDVTGGVVTIKHQPVVGETVYPYGDPYSSSNPEGWPVVVEAYDPAGLNGAGLTTVRHMLNAADVYYVKGTDYDGSTFVLSGFDEQNGTFTISKSDSATGYNGELAGRVLYFQVKVLSIVSS